MSRPTTFHNLVRKHRVVYLIYVRKTKMFIESFFLGDMIMDAESRTFLLSKLKDLNSDLYSDKPRSCLILVKDIKFKERDPIRVALDGKLRKATICETEDLGRFKDFNLRNNEDFKLNNKTKRLIKNKFNELKDMEEISMDALYGYSSSEEESVGEGNLQHIQNLVSAYDKYPPIDDLTAIIPSKEFISLMDIKETIDEEQSQNLQMLLKINYITKGNFTIKGDRVVLNKPCGFAYGDFIKNRDRKYMSKDPSYGISFGISRIHFMDIEEKCYDISYVTK